MQSPKLMSMKGSWSFVSFSQANIIAMIIFTYVPTLASCDDKEPFYDNLISIVKSTPANDKSLVLGNINVRVGNDYENWKYVFGPHGPGKINRNGLLLITICAENFLTIINTLFRLADKYKTMLMYPRSK